ncbi:MAG TPA: DUF4926 domain-containing protein [Chloroflexia bacterium]|nr:DUF4926 domain-containing protein [Chloroflexia bacterium]
MAQYARFEEYQQVRLKHNRLAISDHPFTQLDVPRAVTIRDRGTIVDVHDVKGPGYEVEFFDAHGNTIDVLTLAEDEIEPWA